MDICLQPLSGWEMVQPWNKTTDNTFKTFSVSNIVKLKTLIQTGNTIRHTLWKYH